MQQVFLYNKCKDYYRKNRLCIEYSTIAYEKAICYYGIGLEYETSSNGTFYHHYNNVGNTLALTNTKGRVVEEYTYGVYGELLSGDISKTKFLSPGADLVKGLVHKAPKVFDSSIGKK